MCRLCYTQLSKKLKKQQKCVAVVVFFPLSSLVNSVIFPIVIVIVIIYILSTWNFDFVQHLSLILCLVFFYSRISFSHRSVLVASTASVVNGVMVLYANVKHTLWLFLQNAIRHRQLLHWGNAIRNRSIAVIHSSDCVHIYFG